MRANVVVVLPPGLDYTSRFGATPKPLHAQALVAEAAVETFVGAVLPRLPGSMNAVSIRSANAHLRITLAWPSFGA